MLRCSNCSSPMVSIQSILIRNKNQDWKLKVERNTDVFFEEASGMCMKINCLNCGCLFTKSYENKRGATLTTTKEFFHTHYTNVE